MNTIVRNLIINTGKTFLFCLSAIFLLISCEKELKIRPDDFPPMLVLNGVVEQDSIFCINVSRTASLNETVMLRDLFVTDANVSLYDGDNFLETMQHDSLGFYSSTNTAQWGHKYSIKVEKGDYPVAVANLDFSNAPNFEVSNFTFERHDSTYTYDTTSSRNEILLHEFFVYYDLKLSDNGEENNFYSFIAMTQIQEIMFWNYGSEDEYIELNELNYGDAGVYFEDWSYWDKYNEQHYGGYSFGSETYGFGAIDDKLFNGQEIIFDFYTFFRTSEIETFSLSVKSYPEGLIKYFETCELYYDVYDNPYVEPVNIYSNVENGIGFVCGIPSSKIVFDLE
ncbi:MAG: DUF4249 domain-containing protein [Bacteroidales bacterium]|nr:DUF4249 domain-containing protein [Bacteroidales bacterium]